MKNTSFHYSTLIKLQVYHLCNPESLELPPSPKSTNLEAMSHNPRFPWPVVLINGVEFVGQFYVPGLSPDLGGVSWYSPTGGTLQLPLPFLVQGESVIVLR